MDEKKSLYELMNEKLTKINSKRKYTKIDEFITDPKKCIEFIRTLTEGMEEDDDLYEIPEERARHSVITFMLGLVIGEFYDLFNKISTVIECDESDIGNKLWMLTSLNHDLGYFSKRIKNENLDYSKEFKYFLLNDGVDKDTMKLCDYKDMYINVLAYNYDEILSYDSYARKFHSSRKDKIESFLYTLNESRN